jgi:hypothetical protein
VEFFTPRDAPTCVNDDFRVYFDEPDLPDGTCETAACRCTDCWRAGRGQDDDVQPPLLVALSQGSWSRPRGGDERAAQARIVHNVERLLRGRWSGLSRFYMEKTLRGEDRFWSARSGKMETLWPELVNTAVFGAMPSLKRVELDSALKRLVAAGRVVVVDPSHLFRWAAHARSQEAQEARRATEARRAAEGKAEPFRAPFETTS